MEWPFGCADRSSRRGQITASLWLTWQGLLRRHVRFGSWLCENSKTKFARRNFVSSFVNFKTNSAGDRCRKKTIEKIILRLPGALAFLHSLGHELLRRRRASAAVIPHITDTEADDRRGRIGPILLQKSFLIIDHEISWL
jgi:hypothetical protein